ncbi:MAG: mechanosensitive ion channel, partial [Flavobacteriales bacterium]|nr:mechanosensitive ion channel [Flavobacteriales bacterium]
MNFLELSELLRKWLSHWISSEWLPLVTFLVGFAVLAAICFTIWFFTRVVIIRIVRAIVTRTESRWDDKLFEYKVFRHLALIVIAIIITHAVPVLFRQYPDWKVFALPVSKVYVVVAIIRAISAIINAISDLLESTPSLSDKPIRSYKQVTKIVFFLVGFIFILSILLGQSPLYILTGFGAVTAILLLIFKDAILGFTASIQMSAIDLVRIGDWITVEKFGADGEVIEINLTTVKVRNWDMTVTLVPAYALVSESFRNWRGMQESDGRRIKRFIYIKISSIRYCDDEMYNRLLKVQLIRDFLIGRRNEIESYNQQNQIDKSLLINGRHLTNIGIFRQYAQTYLEQNPNINTGMTFMVRQLQPTQHGLPMEVYAFSHIKELEAFEGVAADIFDHLFAAVPFFGLEVFESPSGGDKKAAEESS